MFRIRSLTASRHTFKARARSDARRTIFSPPPLSSFFQSQPEEPQTYHERKIFPYRRSQLYNVVCDVKSYPRFLPYCTNTRILSRSQVATAGADAVTKMDVEMTVRFMAFEATYTSDVTCTPNLSVEAVASSSSPIFDSLSTVWRFQPASPQSPHPSNASPLSNPLQPGSNPAAEVAADNGPTLVTLDLSFMFAHAAYAGASQMFFGQVSKMMVSAFEQRCLELYGPGNK
ncbi:coenzyme q-binding protein coq10-like protein [Phanerochaete sordida]|uniref:Coenzyme q-binding protein coq10-like protein n=1 Tax=Phanerochaete sordida TaxID=48140 RepID=A0A9P3FXT7_9APHY|nr:coenzyme q-binding protein coq10-like protein [Phanerochaete sordida]